MSTDAVPAFITNKEIIKRFPRRNSYFSDFDNKAALTTPELWLSVTPDLISHMIASESSRGGAKHEVFDMCTVSGRDAISFASHPNVSRVHTYEPNEEHKKCAVNNIMSHDQEGKIIWHHTFESMVARARQCSDCIVYIDAPWETTSEDTTFGVDGQFKLHLVNEWLAGITCIIKCSPKIITADLIDMYQPRFGMTTINQVYVQNKHSMSIVVVRPASFDTTIPTVFRAAPADTIILPNETPPTGIRMDHGTLVQDGPRVFLNPGLQRNIA